jgi:hypothetical protein
MSENKSNPSGKVIITLAIILVLIYYFLKYAGKFLGYLLIIAGIAYLVYSLINKRKSGNIYNLLEAKFVPFTPKLLGINLVMFIVSGTLLIGIGNWLNLSYCECKEIVTNGETKLALGFGNYDRLFSGKEVSADEYGDCIELYQEDLRNGTGLDRGIYGTPIGYFDYKCENQISIVKSMEVLYGNMKYKFGWGRAEEEEELDNWEAEILKNLPPKPAQSPIKDSIDTGTTNKTANEVIAQSDVSPKYSINDPDGYTNLRETPGGKILKKVYEDEVFELLEKGTDYSKIRLKDGVIGFMHNSRIVQVNR